MTFSSSTILEKFRINCYSKSNNLEHQLGQRVSAASGLAVV